MKHWAKINCLTFWGNDNCVSLGERAINRSWGGGGAFGDLSAGIWTFSWCMHLLSNKFKILSRCMKGKSNAVFPSSKCGTEESPSPFMANDPHLELNPSICHFWRGKNPSLSTSLSSLYWVMIFLQTHLNFFFIAPPLSRTSLHPTPNNWELYIGSLLSLIFLQGFPFHQHKVMYRNSLDFFPWCRNLWEMRRASHPTIYHRLLNAFCWLHKSVKIEQLLPVYWKVSVGFIKGERYLPSVRGGCQSCLAMIGIYLLIQRT